MNLKNQIYTGANGRKSLVDFQEPKYKYKDIVVFIHGYKGFKDWGAWNLVQFYFVSSGMAFCKFNMSHNGGTITNPIDFPDLEAFSLNRYTYELEDVKQVLNWLGNQVELADKRIHLIGHSKGGGVAILASRDERVSSVTTWASISNIESRFPKGEFLEKWRKDGVYFVENTRTKQEMPHKFILYKDWEENKEVLNIEESAKSLKIPALHIHGDKDETVSITESEALSLWTDGDLVIIANANHTFKTQQPYDKKQMPNKLNEVCSFSFRFIDRQS